MVSLALYTGRNSRIRSSQRLSGPGEKKPYREKSINDARNEFREPFQCDLIAISRLIPDLYLTLPRIVARPLKCNYVLSWLETETEEKVGRGGGGGLGEGGGRKGEEEEQLTAMRI